MAAGNKLGSDFPALANLSWPGFFKVVLAETLPQKKMMFPEKFVMDFGDKFSDEVSLVAPNGHASKLGLTRSEKAIFFERNWTEFAKYYNLAAGHFITFHYKGFSTFKVRIYELSGCEISYPSYSLKEVDLAQTINEMQDSKNANSSRKRLKAKKGKSNDVAKISKDVGGFEVGFRKACPKYQNAIRQSRMFKSKKPNFRVMLHGSNSTFVYLPNRFSKLYMKGPSEFFILRHSDRRDWNVGITQRTNGRLIISRGWKIFSTENQLKEGDICIFELEEHYVFRVSVIRGPQNACTWYFFCCYA